MIFGSKLFRKTTVKNSLAWAREYLDTAPDGSIFIADEIEHARGRHPSRTWQTAPGQLLITALLKPACLTSIPHDDLSVRLNQLNMALTVGICEPLKNYGVQIKWPNDFYAQDKKVGGMLMQAIWEKQKLKGLILGFALNVNNSFEPEHELFETAISLSMLDKKNANMRELYKKILVSLDTQYLNWQNCAYSQIYNHWKEGQAYLGKKLSIHEKNGETFSGILKQLLPNGDAIFQTSKKPFHHVSFHMIEEVKV